MGISRTLHTLFTNIFGGNPDDFWKHWSKYLYDDHKNEFHEFNSYSAIPLFFGAHAYCLPEFLAALESVAMRYDVLYGDPMLDKDDGCWFPENDDYNEIPLSQIMFKFGDNEDYVSDDEFKKIVSMAANICLNIFNEYNYPLDMPERKSLSKIMKRIEEL